MSLLSLLLAGMLVLACGCGGASSSGQADAPAGQVDASSGEANDGPIAKVAGKEFLLRDSQGAYQPVFLNGVNIGAAKSGYFPGEFGVTKEDYLRWFQYISDMNVQVVRVYVNLMPAFYDALYQFNLQAETPLYLMHGVYLNEDMIDQYMDAYGGDGAIVEQYVSDIHNAVDMVHGNAQVEKLPGNAGGEYTSDVSPWLIGWILGIEWSADFVLGTNQANPEKTSFTGEYVVTRDASPFEVFLAETTEEAIAYETRRYSQQRPVAVSNWCTTDPLAHPNEPNAEMEDAATVDVEHILATEAFEPGFFASYHAYPYYPDFFSYDTKYLGGDDPDPYYAYLEELNSYHSMPVLISEYGIPSSRGIAHKNMVTGMSQGFASEEQQGLWIISLNQDIVKTGCMGAFIFSWQSEWFKRTWNSMDYEDPERRPYWKNVQSPEECFGLMSFDLGETETLVNLDGKPREWTYRDLICHHDGVRLYAKSDAAYLYLLIRAEDYDFDSDTLYIPLDVLDGQGNTGYQGCRFSSGAEFLLRLQGREGSAVLTDAYYDVFQFDYSQRLGYFDPLPGEFEKDSGCFNPIYLAMNRPQHLPQTNVDNPFERFETGVLLYGNGDPESPDFNSLADFCVSENAVEIRLPWMMLGFMDPSRKEVIGDFHSLGEIRSASSQGVRMGVCREGAETTAPMELYTWDNWDIPPTHERLKQSYYLLQEYFGGQG